MTVSHAPDTDAERATCIAAMAEISHTTVNAVIAVQLADDYLPSVAAYAAARTASEVASSAADLASAAAKTADAAFVTAFNRWVLSIDQSVGKRTTAAVLRPLLGNRTPSAFLHGGRRRKADKMVDLLVHVRETPGLAPDAAAVDGLKTATAALTRAVEDQESALRSRATAVKAADAATTRFDGAYGLLVRAILRRDPEGLGATLPRFHRGDPPEVEPTAPVEAVDPPPAVDPAPETSPETSAPAPSTPPPAPAPAPPPVARRRSRRRGRQR